MCLMPWMTPDETGDMSSDMRFRSDINGLRAWAVVAVIFYHFEVSGFSSGFVGVDIFFVISGYLMTRIIVEGYERSLSGGKPFSLIAFYLARARRIIPALAFLGIALLILGWIFLTTEEYRDLGSETLFALTFTSNFKYWFQSGVYGGYFAEYQPLKWFRHSWSLSVEWQFYLILPLIIGVVWRLTRRRSAVMHALIGVMALSFVASALNFGRDPELAFYSIHTRAWEMLAGGMVFFVRIQTELMQRYSKRIELVGIAFILASIFLDQPEQTWPGYRASLPVLGAVLVLLADRQKSIWTSLTAAQYLGIISYSLYLWHWPVVVGLKYMGLLAQPEWLVAGIVVTFLMSVLSYHVVEKPARKWIDHQSVWAALTLAAVIAIIPVGAGALVRLVPNVHTLASAMQVSARPAGFDDYHPRRDECLKTGIVPGPICQFGGEKLAAIALGDSHDLAVVGAIQRALPRDDLHVLTISTSACPTLLKAEAKDSRLNCREFNAWAIEKLEEFDSSIPVIITNRTSAALFGPNESPIANRQPKVEYDQAGKGLLDAYRADQLATFCKIASQRPTYVLMPIPEMGYNVPSLVDRWRRLGRTIDVSVDRGSYDKRQEFVRETYEAAATQCDIQLLDPAEYLCSESKCWGSKDGVIRYFDDDHLSETGNQLLIPMFKTIWNVHG